MPTAGRLKVLTGALIDRPEPSGVTQMAIMLPSAALTVEGALLGKPAQGPLVVSRA